MPFWDIFKSKEKSDDSSSGLHQKLIDHFPHKSDQDQILLSCLAGLLASVAYIDFEVHPKEKENIKNSLIKWCKLSDEDAANVADVAIQEIIELSGLENHLYCHPLNDILSTDQRYGVVEALFDMASSDGKVDESEAEEIRMINKGLRLEHKHFVSARATVLQNIGSLKGE